MGETYVKIGNAQTRRCCEGQHAPKVLAPGKGVHGGVVLVAQPYPRQRWPRCYGMSTVENSVPLMFDPAEAMTWLVDRDREPTADEVETIMGRLGRVHAPWVLGELYCYDLLGDDVATALVGQAWSIAEYPEDALGCDLWLELFDLAGFTVDGKAAPRPTQPLTLYRGAPEDRRARMAWTDSVDEAQRFATGLRTRETGELWTATVEPWRLLTVDNGRTEHEHVINPDGLEIIRYAVGSPALRPESGTPDHPGVPAAPGQTARPLALARGLLKPDARG